MLHFRGGPQLQLGFRSLATGFDERLSRCVCECEKQKQVGHHPDAYAASPEREQRIIQVVAYVPSLKKLEHVVDRWKENCRRGGCDDAPPCRVQLATHACSDQHQGVEGENGLESPAGSEERAVLSVQWEC